MIPREELENYIQAGLTNTALAEHYKCSKATIINYIKKYQLTGKRPKGRPGNSSHLIDREKLTQLIQASKTNKQIAEYFACSTQNVQYAVKTAGLIGLRYSKQHYVNWDAIATAVEEHWPIKEICDTYNIHPTTLRDHYPNYKKTPKEASATRRLYRQLDAIEVDNSK